MCIRRELMIHAGFIGLALLVNPLAMLVAIVYDIL